jgi:hypothetical protein
MTVPVAASPGRGELGVWCMAAPAPFPGGAWSAGRLGAGRTKLGCVSEAQPGPEDQPGPDDQPGPEDLKIITLARAARARVTAAEGAAVRDEIGRTYAAAAVALPSLRMSALQLAVAMAVSSGAGSLEAAALVSDDDGPDPADVVAVRDVGPEAVVFHVGPDGSVKAMLRP